MTLETILILVLSILAGLLGVLLFMRIRSEKRRLGVVMRMNLIEFSEFLRTNSLEGNILAVAAKVSTLLSKTFGCDRIIFLRKKRGDLELNYYHGITGFNRRDFQMPYRNELAAKLSQDFMPIKIEAIKTLLPQKFYENLIIQKVDVYFPIYWRTNLYGVYFVNSNKETRSPAFTLLIASLAHSLSAAYHIKWHESRFDELEKKFESAKKPHPQEPAPVARPENTFGEFSALIKLKDADVLMPRLISAIGDNLNFEKFAFCFSNRNEPPEHRQINKGLKEKIEIPGTTALRKLSTRIKGHGPQIIEKLKDMDVPTEKWLNQLRQSGLEYIVDFPLAESDDGILAWSGPALTKDRQSGLAAYQKLAADLIENADAYRQAEMMSYTDALTGLSNQRFMYKRLEEEINRSRRYTRPLAFIIFDIDELKNINDSFGHLAGDALLKQVGQALKKSTRAIDIVARYGGDEFCVVMPESDEETCVKFMQRMLDTIATTEIRWEGTTEPVHCSVSLGGALFPRHAQDAQKLIYAADMALLQAKESGRNRFIIYTPKEAAAGHQPG